MEFKDKLKKLREEKGISQYKLASDLFVSRSSVARWENGIGLPSEDAKERLSKYFDVSMDYLNEQEDEIEIVEKRWRKKSIQNLIFRIAIKVLIISIAITCIVLITLAVEKGKKAQKSLYVYLTTEDTVYDYSVGEAFGVGNCRLNEIHSTTDTPAIPESIFVLTGLFKEKYNVRELILNGFDYKNLYIPSHIENIYGCADHYKSITVDKNNTYYDSREDSNCLIETKTNRLMAVSDFNSFVPDSVKTIGMFSFLFTPYEKVIIPEGVELIEQQAFQEMPNLKEIVFPKSLKRIDAFAFYYSLELTSIVLEDGVQYINPQAFDNSNIQVIYYKGNEKNFKAVMNDCTRKVYYYGEYEPAQKDKYWHYVNGIPTVWR